MIATMPGGVRQPDERGVETLVDQEIHLPAGCSLMRSGSLLDQGR